MMEGWRGCLGSSIVCGKGAVGQDESDYDKHVLTDDRKFGSVTFRRSPILSEQ